jgi:hypothetical protein
MMTSSLLAIAQAGLNSPDERVFNAAESTISYVGFHLRDTWVDLPPEMVPCAERLQRYAREDLWESPTQERGPQ